MEENVESGAVEAAKPSRKRRWDYEQWRTGQYCKDRSWEHDAEHVMAKLRRRVEKVLRELGKRGMCIWCGSDGNLYAFESVMPPRTMEGKVDGNKACFVVEGNMPQCAVGGGEVAMWDGSPGNIGDLSDKKEDDDGEDVR